MLGSEGPGDFLLHLHHAKIPFGQVIVEGDVEVVDEGRGLVAMMIKPFEQVARFGLLGPPAFLLCLGRLRRQWVLSIALIKDLLITRFKCPDLPFRKMVRARFGLIDRVFDIQQAVDHEISPVLLVLLMHEEQLAQMVSVAQPMEA